MNDILRDLIIGYTLEYLGYVVIGLVLLSPFALIGLGIWAMLHKPESKPDMEGFTPEQVERLEQLRARYYQMADDEIDRARRDAW